MKSDLVETNPGSNVYVDSGNVFTDLGFNDAEEMTTKVRLSVVINNILRDRKMTQKAAAKLLGVNQPKISALQNYKLDGFSVERLMAFATGLGYDVLIELKPRPERDGAGHVIVVKAA
jgi:predicted XRE-type DNA-binding protein